MNIAGIIAEYNPFHNGHALHIRQTRQITGCSHVIVAMSGHFVQRGEAAVFDKWSRAEMAIHSGADLVVELPFVYAVRSAQYFATGGIRLLAALGASYLSFGAEHADLPLLSEAAQAMFNPSFTANFRSQLDQGVTYARAMERSLTIQTDLPSAFLTSPNNILAIEYLRALTSWAPHIRPIPVRREQAAYHDPVIRCEIASATAIRQVLLHGQATEIRQAVPSASYAIIEDLIQIRKGPVKPQSFDSILLAKIRSASPEELAAIPDMTEGLHYKTAESALRATDSESFFQLLKSKRYTRTRLQRMAIHILIGTSKEILASFDDSGPLYGRVLAFNNKGRELLRHLSTHASIPLVTKTAAMLSSRDRHQVHLTPAQQMLVFDTKASDFFVLAMPDTRWRSGAWDFLQSPIYVR